MTASRFRQEVQSLEGSLQLAEYRRLCIERSTWLTQER